MNKRNSIIGTLVVMLAAGAAWAFGLFGGRIRLSPSCNKCANKCSPKMCRTAATTPRCFSPADGRHNRRPTAVLLIGPPAVGAIRPAANGSVF